MKEITIVADDKVGLLADISYVLSKAKINIETISVDVTAGKAVITLGLSDVDKGKNVLESAGYSTEELNSVVLKLPDQPGELNRITSMLSKEGINIEKVRMISKSDKNTIIAINVDKPKRAAVILKNMLITKESAY